MYEQDQEMPQYPRRKRRWWLLVPAMLAGGILLALVAGGVVMWLWNAILPDIAPVKPLNFYQALGLLVLCRILFGGFKGGGPGFRKGNPSAHRFRQKWREMSNDERAQFRAAWRRRCGHHD